MMVSRSLRLSQAKLLMVALVLLLAGCQPSTGCSGCITIPQSDATPPELTLGAGLAGDTQDGVTVTDTTTGQTLIHLTSKAGSLNLLATAKDAESGIQSLKIFVITQANISDYINFFDSLKATYEFSSPQKQPGELTPDGSILAEALDMDKDVPAGCKVVPTADIFIYAVAINHLGGKTQTADISVNFCP